VNSLTWDPEGILTDDPSDGTAMLGNLAGQAAARRPADRLNGLFGAGRWE
jgi:hypothetical protein